MTDYLRSVHMVEGEPEPSEETVTQMYADVDKLNTEIQEQGAWVFAGGLHPPTTATVVRAHEGDVLVTDGPFAEATEQLGGFWIISAPDLDVAMDAAGQRGVPGAGRASTVPGGRRVVGSADRCRCRRPDIPAGVRARGRGAHAGVRRPRHREGGGAGRLRRRGPALAGRRTPAEPGAGWIITTARNAGRH